MVRPSRIVVDAVLQTLAGQLAEGLQRSLKREILMLAAVNEQLTTDRNHGDSPVLDRVSFRSTGKNYQPVFDEGALR